jgi:hypothetical protein
LYYFYSRVKFKISSSERQNRKENMQSSSEAVRVQQKTEQSSPDSSSDTTTTTAGSMAVVGVSTAEIVWNDMYSETIAAISNEMPLLMHGAGDVVPDEVDPATAKLLSALTVQYISRFVDAAIDSREMLLDHQHLFYPKRKKISKKRKLQQQQASDTNKSGTNPSTNTSTLGTGGGGNHGSNGTKLYTRMIRPDPPLPPPSYYHSRRPDIPPPPDVDDDTKDKIQKNGTNGGVGIGSNKLGSFDKTKISIPRYLQEASKALDKKRKRLHNVDYWDEPLPEPKIKNKNVVVSTGQHHTPQSRLSVAATDNIHVDEWVGAAGVDLFEHRCRAAYVRGTAAITTQSFIFPICHDVYTYGRIRELQTAKRTAFNSGTILQDTSLMDVIRTEGRNFLKRNKKKKQLKGKASKSKSNNERSTSGGTSDPDDDDENNDDSDSDMSNDGEGPEGPMWPGLEGLLPIYRSAYD